MRRAEVYKAVQHSTAHDRRNIVWRWRIVGANGRIMANGGEPFASSSSAKAAVKRILALSADLPIKMIR